MGSLSNENTTRLLLVLFGRHTVCRLVDVCSISIEYRTNNSCDSPSVVKVGVHL